ncbi:hypothetical protein EV188_11621 [Actinomycetospora succinea]|uniref:Uncharacterized protein n=1 Tax=Actinomycetospora succinea TaxID=663603 RepID=A0A4R6ULW9_9PSEU|nr:hypothetical protein [Actinomycetospora succinea]TDQ46393.1 hypothetical protein EV188_11621 [Actinomycetospora succinea]
MSPDRYELRIEGRVSEDVSGDFAEFEVREAPPETLMYGEIVDDAHLHGVLARLQDLGLRVTSFRTVPAPRDGDGR